MPTRLYRLTFTPTPDGVFVELADHRAGPFPTDLAAEHHVLEVLRRWRARAAELGGWVNRPTKGEVTVTVPEGVEIRGGEDLHEVAMRRWRT